MAKMKNCTSCGTEIATTAKACPKCGAKNKKPIYKRAWFIILIVIVLVGVISGMGGGDDSETASTDGQAEQTQEKTEETKEISYTAYTVDQLVDDLEENAMKASDTYLDQNVELTGSLSNIDSSGDYISIDPLNDEYSFVNVQCFIQNEEQIEIIKELSTGDILVIKGKITDVGEILGYSMDIDSVAKQE